MLKQTIIIDLDVITSFTNETFKTASNIISTVYIDDRFIGTLAVICGIFDTNFTFSAVEWLLVCVLQ